MSPAPDHEAYLCAAVLLALRGAQGEDVSAAADVLAGMAGEDAPAEEE
jgi:hypothetical protein